ncbi:hypothetical protein JKF63_00121 [Porcisia hertigi]|uniref:J domain-containing protein n=1 Tax=Porcisia hertigi TaxID=2761500 RepID=A0A836GXQ5_9TRYP|nr:hypothetical protein JKF63_00121 [Porcisia hertigi]
MLRRVSHQKDAASATLRLRLQIAGSCTFLRYRSPLLSDVVSQAFPVLRLSARRWCATPPRDRSSASGAPSIDGEAVIRAANWRSSNFEERLGFRVGEAITEERLKRHYYILAKHFHPDAAGAGSHGRSSGSIAAHQGLPGAGAEGAFQNVKEAYDGIQQALKQDSRRNGNASRGFSRSDFAGGFEYSDEARRRSQMRLIGDAVILFLFMTVAFILIVSRHNKSRMQSRYLWHLVWIFFMIQLFPRLLAAAILFAAHSMQLLENATLQEQAAISLIVDRAEKGCTVTMEGLRPEALPNVVVQVTTTWATDTEPADTVSSTLTFDKGITKFTLPVPAYSGCTYHIKAVDETRRIVLVDRSLSAKV